jgi:TPR repeat protein
MSAFASHRGGVGGKVSAMVAPLALALALLGGGTAHALDGSQPATMDKIPLKLFKSAEQALRMGVEQYRSGDAKSSVDALKYAAAGGESLAQWKLGRMYAQGDGVPRDDVKAYEYFNAIVDAYDEDQPERRDISAVSNAFVAVGIYCLNGIANSDVKADPERAEEMFQYAATSFGDPDAQYNLARMYLDGALGPRDAMRAARWLFLAAEKSHRPAQAVLGNLLFLGDGVPRQHARGLMWLWVARDGAQGAPDQWIRDLYARDYALADDNDRQLAQLLLNEHARVTHETVPGPTAALAPPPASPEKIIIRPPGVIPAESAATTPRVVGPDGH